MDFQDMAAAIKSAADSVRKTPAVRKGNKVSYTIVVKVGYEEIKKLRDDGYSYETICKIFSEKGLLGDNARPTSFCTAFLRETKRRVSRADGRNPSMGTGSAPAKKTDAGFPAARTSGVAPVQRTAESGDRVKPDDAEAMTAAEKEILNKKLGFDKKFKRGPGIQTIRLPDGSFEIL